MNDHFIFSDSSISSDSGLEHIKLNDVRSLNIPNVSLEHLESIMSEMTKDGMYRPTMNYIIEAHKHLEEMTERTSLITSTIIWIVFGVLFVFIIAFLLYIFHYLYQIRATITSILKINTQKALRTFITIFLRPSGPARIAIFLTRERYREIIYFIDIARNNNSSS
jgi:hypothetical protein